MMDEGGRILRVHDTKATSRLIKAYQTYKRV